MKTHDFLLVVSTNNCSMQMRIIYKNLILNFIILCGTRHRYDALSRIIGTQQGPLKIWTCFIQSILADDTIFKNFNGFFKFFLGRSYRRLKQNYLYSIQRYIQGIQLGGGAYNKLPPPPKKRFLACFQTCHSCNLD